MSAFIVRLIIYVIINLLIHFLFADSGPEIADAKPGEFEAPVVTASQSIPVLFGTQIMSAPNVVWYGNIKTIPWEKCA